MFGYELEMYFETRRLVKYLSARRDSRDVANLIIRNAVMESQTLHTRIMAEILFSKTSHPKDDISLAGLSAEFSESAIGKKLVYDLKYSYGASGERNTPCWVINKMLVHPTRL